VFFAKVVKKAGEVVDSVNSLIFQMEIFALMEVKEKC
jgi:hypothetical protein